MQQKNHRSVSLLLCFLLICLQPWTLPTFFLNKKRLENKKKRKKRKKRDHNKKTQKNVYFTSMEYCDECVCLTVCVCVCLSAIISSELHFRSSPDFLCVLILGRGSVLPWRRSDTLCTSGFTDDVIFAHKPRLLDVAAQLKRSAYAALGLAVNCAVIPVAGHLTHGTTVLSLLCHIAVQSSGVEYGRHTGSVYFRWQQSLKV